MLIRKIDPSGIITTIAGSGTGSALGDGGPAISATFNTPIYLSFDATGNLYVCDWGNSRVRKIDTAGIITTVAGIGTNTYSGDSGPAVSAGLSVSGLLIDHSGNILVCDATNGRIRKIDTTGIITTFVSGLNFPCCMVGDNSGNIYVNNEDAQTIVKIDTSGAMTVVAGTGVEDFSGDGGPAIDAAFGYPSGITIDSCNNLYISDLWNNRVRQISYEPACNKFNSLGVSNTIISNSIIYPNPASDVLTISTGIKIGQISISDMFDQTLLTKTCNASKVEIDISKLPAGVYFVTINGPDSYREVSKFLKE